ncbi:MAG TPA: 50S ribosomal protein L3 N(5)-glutamine methyltransferase [Opitutaceae bacterium]
MTVGGWLRRAERMYGESGAALGQIATGARDEALYLVLRTLNLPLGSAPTVLARKLSAPESAAVAGVFRRRLVDRVPAAYITGEAWLGGLRFHVDERVLIPRSYFVEILPEQVDPWIPDPRKVTRVADVCTGSGCLAVLLARHFKGARVDAVDLSPGALEVAKINVARHRLAGRIRLVAGDLLKAAPAGRYDVILSNPPYEPSAHVDALPEEFRREPRLALDGGPDGLDLVRRLVRESAARLRPHGILMIEVGGGRDAFEREFARLEPHWFHTEDASDCVCVIQAARLQRRQARVRS